MSVANPFLYSEAHLGRAGSLLLLEVLGGVALSFVLQHLGYSNAHVFVAMWLLNLWTAWCLAQAARAKGRSAMGYGLFSALAPATAIISWAMLSRLESIHMLEQLATTGSNDSSGVFVDADGVVHTLAPISHEIRMEDPANDRDRQ